MTKSSKIICRNPNHPKKGDIIRVYPIRKKDHIQQIKDNLKGQPRNRAIFVLGINTALRASDLLRITFGQVDGLGVGENFVIREKKTKKVRRVFLNESSHAAVADYLKVRRKTGGNVPLFLSRCGYNRSIGVNYLNNLMKKWCKQVGIRENIGSHTLRKTWGYQQRMLGTDIPVLMVAMNHSNQRQTLNYLGIEEEEVMDAFLQAL